MQTTNAEPHRRPMPSPWRELTIPLAAADTAALTHVRALARRALAAWNTDNELADNILIVLSELATNALIHTDGPAELRLTRCAGHIRLDLSDTSRDEPDWQTGPVHDEHGYGLALIAATLADKVTCTPQRGGKTISAIFGTDVKR